MLHLPRDMQHLTMGLSQCVQIPVGHAFEKYAKKLQEEHEKGGDVEA